MGNLKYCLADQTADTAAIVRKYQPAEPTAIVSKALKILFFPSNFCVFPVRSTSNRFINLIVDLPAVQHSNWTSPDLVLAAGSCVHGKADLLILKPVTSTSTASRRRERATSSSPGSALATVVVSSTHNSGSASAGPRYVASEMNPETVTMDIVYCVVYIRRVR